MKNPETTLPVRKLKEYAHAPWRVNTVALTVDLDYANTVVHATLTLQRVHDAPLILHGESLQLRAIAIDGGALPTAAYSYVDSLLTIHAPLPAQCQLTTTVALNPSSNHALEGLYQANAMLCTQCEAEGFRRITFMLDRPDILAVYTVTLRGDKQLFPQLLSNGNLIESTQLAGGRHTATWHDPHPKPSYLFALVAGDFHCAQTTFTTQSGKIIPLQIFVEHHNSHKCDFALKALAKAMRWDEQQYGREYDLDQFMIVATDDFNSGAMENKGLNIFNTSCVLAHRDTCVDAAFEKIEAIIAHEYFHNWSGNRVTCRDWFQLSLKEGFTVFRDSQFTAAMHSAALKRIDDVIVLRSQQFAEDASATAHPVRPTSYVEIRNFYTLTVYEKGAELIRMLYQLLGKATFRNATDCYFATFDGQAATVENFIDCMQQASGRDLQQFMLWYSQEGTPQVKITTTYDAAAATLTCQFEQFFLPLPRQRDNKPMLIPIRLALFDAAGKQLPLFSEGIANQQECVIECNTSQQQVVFHTLNTAPIVSLLRGFSAPVQIHYQQPLAGLVLLAQHDTDDFVRWDAARILQLRAIESGCLDNPAAASCLQQIFATLLEQAQQYCLTSITTSGRRFALLSQILRLPDLNYLLNESQQSYAVLHANLNTLTTECAEQFASQWLQLYTQLYAYNTSCSYDVSVQQTGVRRLQNLALSMLLSHPTADHSALAVRQYTTATNMTDGKAALQALVHHQHLFTNAAIVPDLLTAFYNKWQQDPLMVNQWFELQAGRPHPTTLQDIAALAQHPAFSLRNPNRVRAVYGVLSMHNPVAFHSADGSGYRVIADVVSRIDTFNPQIAARLAVALTRWNKLDLKRQQAMQDALQSAQSSQCSNDLREVIHKGLAAISPA